MPPMNADFRWAVGDSIWRWWLAHNLSTAGAGASLARTAVRAGSAAAEVALPRSRSDGQPSASLPLPLLCSVAL